MRELPILSFFILTQLLLMANCQSGTINTQEPLAIPNIEVRNKKLKLGAERTDLYFPILKNKRIGMVVNQTSMIGEVSIVDSLLNAGLDVQKIFAPEHGFRGTADAGQVVKDGKDVQTGLPIISLYGKNKKPSAAQFSNLDIVIFDIQDVGARFYTYISTMHYVMQTAAEINIPILILDRPNPNGHYVDGPVLEKEHSSFVGLHTVPIVHGMTIGEYAQMINGERWIGDELKCDLKVISCENYTHQTVYTLPVKPSPNLPSNLSIYLYPSMCLFEGTIVSVGRGTEKQFQIFGHPNSEIGDISFTPVPMPGAMHPKHEGKSCRGFDFSDSNMDSILANKKLDISLLIDFYKDAEDKENFFKPFFTKLAGTENLQKQIESGLSASEIRKSWQPKLEEFRKIRAKYLLYN